MQSIRVLRARATNHVEHANPRRIVHFARAYPSYLKCSNLAILGFAKHIAASTSQGELRRLARHGPTSIGAMEVAGYPAPVRHPLLERETFEKLQRNDVVEIRPHILHFGGFQVHKARSKRTLKANRG